MTHVSRVGLDGRQPASPLVLCDRFLRLAEDADRAGFRVAAEHLIYLADQVLDAPETLRIGTIPARCSPTQRPR